MKPCFFQTYTYLLLFGRNAFVVLILRHDDDNTVISKLDEMISTNTVLHTGARPNASFEIRYVQVSEHASASPHKRIDSQTLGNVTSDVILSRFRLVGPPIHSAPALISQLVRLVKPTGSELLVHNAIIHVV
jgi:hypothetical protein